MRIPELEEEAEFFLEKERKAARLWSPVGIASLLCSSYALPPLPRRKKRPTCSKASR